MSLTPEQEAALRAYNEHYEGPIRHEPRFRLLRKLAAPFIGLGLLFWKFKFLLAAVFKLKLFTTGATMLVSIGAYALLWPWQFAIGFTLLLLVHELGHVLEARRQGLPVSAPMFIPFLGALITMKQMPDNAWNEAKVALAGPIVGSAGALACWVAAEALGSDLLLGLAFVGFLLNLFNLLPVVPLDGGRAAGALHPAFWLVGMAGLAGLVVLTWNPLLVIILLFGGLELWNRWQLRRDPEYQAYYRIPTSQRVAVGLVYLGLAAALALGMTATFVEREL